MLQYITTLFIKFAIGRKMENKKKKEKIERQRTKKKKGNVGPLMGHQEHNVDAKGKVLDFFKNRESNS